jgi:predicted  nucleic acid-binding Zn-ribbon protein
MIKTMTNIDVELYTQKSNVETNPPEITIEISNLTTLQKFIGLEDTPIYYENGKFFKVIDNKIVYTDINWEDIKGEVKNNPDLYTEVTQLVEENAGKYVEQIAGGFIDNHNKDINAHPDIRNNIQENYDILNEKIELNKLDTENNFKETKKNIQTNVENIGKLDSYTQELNTKIENLTIKIDVDIQGEIDSLKDDLESTNQEIVDNFDILDKKIDNNFETLNNTIDTTKEEFNQSITNLGERVTTNEGDIAQLKTDVVNNKDELEKSISDTNTRIGNEVDTLNTTITTKEGELNGKISDLNTVVENNYTTLDTKIDTNVDTINGEISELTTTVENNYTTLDTKINTNVDTINKTISDTKEELNQSIGDLDKSLTDLGEKVAKNEEKHNSDINDINNDISNLDNKKADKATTLLGYNIQDAYTKSEVDAKVASVYKIKGSVDTFDDLPTEGNVIGDVYNILDTGANYVWTEDGWDKLSETVDLTPYLLKEDAQIIYETIKNVEGIKELLELGIDKVKENVDTNTENISQLQTDVSDLNTAIETEVNRATEKENDLDERITSNTTNITTNTNDIATNVANISNLQTSVSGLQTSKQDKLTAGESIKIEDNTISNTMSIIFRDWSTDE